jgi:two-component system response regulator FixJ
MFKRCPIYIVDDDPALRFWMAELCEEAGLDHKAFETGTEFLAAVDGLPAGCVLLDMRMPGLSGLQVQADLERRGSMMTVVAMTGFGGVEVAVQAMKLGAVEFLEKPFTGEDLLAAITAAGACCPPKE